MEELENSDASESHVRRLNAEEIITPKLVNTSYSQSQMDQWERSGRFRKSTFVLDQPKRGEEQQDDLQGESDGSQAIDTMTFPIPLR